MTTTQSITQSWIRPEIHRAFVAASHVVFNCSSLSALSTRDHGALSVQFARRYESMCALPRRTRRALERSWKKPLAAIALLLTLGQGTALAATITVGANTPPPIQADGQCSLVEAMINANDDAATHADCVAGNGVDTLVLPAGSVQSTSPTYGPNHNLGLPSIESPIVIEGRGSEIVGQAGIGVVLDIGVSGTLTLNDTIVSDIGSGPYNPYNHPNGGIYNRGTLTLSRSTITRCRNGGLTNSGGTVTLNDSTISDNRGDFYPGPRYKGGGITNRGGTVTLVNSTVKNNSGMYGAGISNSTHSTLIVRNSTVQANRSGSGIVNAGILTVSHSRIIDNSAELGGGGIKNHSSAVATISHSTLSGNVAKGYPYGGDMGGGIHNAGGTMTISDSTIAGNTVTVQYYGEGGGIANAGMLTISSSILSDNEISPSYPDSVSSCGGAISNAGRDDQLTIGTSTISNNRARGGPDVYPSFRGYGGAICSHGGTVTISNSTITGNSSDIGGGISVPASSSAQVTLMRALVSGNTASIAGAEIQNDDRSGGSVIADDYNLIGQNGDAGSVGFTPGPTDIVPIQPVSGILLPLVNNGGTSRTKTHALAIGSPALDASPANDGCSAKDQRGARRPRGKACDIGAFEGSAVMCGGVVTTHVGTPGRDVILGTPGPDVIAGLGSGDVIRGLDGDDMICGGKGTDRLVGGPGIDTLLGEAGDDVLLGQGNDDVLNGGIGTDQCDGGKNDAAGDFAAQCETVVNVP